MLFLPLVDFHIFTLVFLDKRLRLSVFQFFFLMSFKPHFKIKEKFLLIFFFYGNMYVLFMCPWLCINLIASEILCGNFMK